MNTLTLKQNTNPLFSVQQPKRREKITLRRILYTKFLRWVNKSKTGTLLKHCRRFICAVTIFVACVAPSFLLGLLSSLSSNKYAVGVCLVLLYLNMKNVTKLAHFLKPKRSTGNQHTYHGIPVSELADYLIENGAFPAKAIDALRITQPTWRKIAKQLEAHRILKRGENNSRVLNDITRQELVTQLSDDFPLVLCDGEWSTKNGPWRTYLKDKEREEQNSDTEKRRLRQREEGIARRRKELEEIASQDNELHPAFTRRELAISI